MFVSDKARELFAQAQTFSPEARDRFITDACEGNKALQREVDSLLKAAEGSGQFFSKLVNRISLSAIANNDEPLQRGKLLGHWRLGECIGRGGMGAVYLAERADNEFEQRAAVKLLPFGADTDSARNRFLVERQILARLDHDYIARLLDGGVTNEGVPFFVMDYVEGEAIDDYCRTNELNTTDKLALVLDIASALQYAHANLVVHRDLKPSNVLVEKSGRVRLLDFGVAKTLDPGKSDNELTQLAQRPVTPAFASPEMLRGDPVDVTTDVYSTGVLMYLLLTRALPLHFDGLSVADSIKHAERSIPPPASSIDSNIGTDLDTILAKAMAKTPRDRYSSIDNLAADIRHYLAGRPVTAKEPTRMYHFQKFVRRNALAFTTTLAASFALIGLTTFALLQSIETNRQRDLALLEQQRVQASNEFYGLLLDEVGKRGAPLSPVELLDQAVTLLDKQYGTEADFLGRIYLEVMHRYRGIGESDKADTLSTRAELIARENNDNGLLASVLCSAPIQSLTIDPEGTRKRFDEANHLLSMASHVGFDDTVRCMMADALRARADRDLGKSAKLLDDALVLLNDVPNAPVSLVASVMNYQGLIQYELANYDNAFTINQNIEKLNADNGRDSTYGQLVIITNQAAILAGLGELAAASRLRRNAMERMEAMSVSGRGSWETKRQYAELLTQLSKSEESLELLQQVNKHISLADNPFQHALLLLNLATANIKQGNFEETQKLLDQADLTLRDNSSPNMQGNLNRAHIKLALARGDLDNAQRLVNSMLTEADYPNIKRSSGLGATLNLAARVALLKKDYASAFEMASDKLAIDERNSRSMELSANVGRSLFLQAEAQLGLGNEKAAAEGFSKAVISLSNGLGPKNPETLEVQAALVEIAR